MAAPAPACVHDHDDLTLGEGQRHPVSWSCVSRHALHEPMLWFAARILL